MTNLMDVTGPLLDLAKFIEILSTRYTTGKLRTRALTERGVTLATN